jgi:histidyl-tRNA synthetase
VFADADRNGATRVWLIGPDERERGVSRAKDLATGDQHDVPIGAELADLGLPALA